MLRCVFILYRVHLPLGLRHANLLQARKFRPQAACKAYLTKIPPLFEFRTKYI